MRRAGFALAVSVAAAVIACAGPLVGQTVDRRAFGALSNLNNSELACTFRVRSDTGAQMTRRNFVVQLPDWTLTVAQLQGLGITNAAVDTTLDQAADVLKVDQGGADVNCCVDMHRQGNIANFAAPASMVGGIITTQAEQDAVFAVNADIKVVTGIQWCGQAGNPTFAGCADGNSIITVNIFNPPGTTVFTDPVTVAHEAGHWAGLGHVGQTCMPTPGQCGTPPVMGGNGCVGCTDGFANRVMFCRICAGAPTQGVITGAQCSAFANNPQ